MNRVRRASYAVVALAVPAAALLYGLLPASAATAGPITGLGGKCIDVNGASSANGTAVQLYDCTGSSAQQWSAGNTDGSIRALGKCMDVASGSTTNGAKIQLYDCNATG